MVTPADRDPNDTAAPHGAGRADGGAADSAATNASDRGESADATVAPDPAVPPDHVPPPADESAGAGIVRLNVWATAVFAVVSVAAAVAPDPLQYVAVPLDLILFAVGCGAFLWAYAVAIGRSRYEALTMGGVFFPGTQVAPSHVVRTLRLALGVQVVVAVAVASVRPFTALAFGVLVPMLGLGLMALWGARHGRFPSKQA